ncbi:hypothetical protein GOHSU_16_00810 [Gordonia hirsuta DSM 44140 = NBRC 16056]|uniref:PE-PPE domain-containing protein n=1 Tax=Gordonia hirsuta DSM 44140 = NBRC 16056 TaxID=1121927 RepID=L7LAR8_9ACTN|nr:cutinase family protein [Gordonia hirsuta]GAC57123.1 hypothetical protein GOHSU_16_00810 [Gordonia hirsuta DSM 44140 = NBRC 16056]
MSRPPTLYSTLDLDPRAPAHALAGQLQQLIAQTPPGPDQAYLQRALLILGDPAKKQTYDALLADPTVAVTEETLNAIAGAPQQPQPAHPQTGALPPQPAPKKRFSKKLLAALIAAVVVVLVIVIGAVGITASTSADCKDIVFIGAAGSGERSGVKLTAHDGQGEFVNETYRNLLADASAAGKDVDLRVVEYHAAPVTVLLPQPIQAYMQSQTGQQPGAPDEFPASADAGTAVATSMIKDAQQQCPGSTIVAAGYSQGAMVIHRALLNAGNNGSTIGVLIADGDRYPSDPNVIHRGGAVELNGISYTEMGDTFSGQRPERLFPEEWAGSLLSWCGTNPRGTVSDTICANERGKTDAMTGPLVHISDRAYDAQQWRPWLKEKAVGRS